MTTPHTRGAADLPEMVSKALREAYNLGQMYWQQADSEYISQHKKADDTRAKFLALVEETCAALAAGQATAAQGDAIEHELAMLIRRIVSSARRNCQDESNVLKLANEAWAYLVRKGLVGSPLRDAGIESDVGPQAEDSVQEDAAQESQYWRGYRHGYEQRDAEVRGALA